MNALYEAQFDADQPPEGKDWLTRDDLAAGRGGWGVKFKELHEEGYFPNAKNFGEIVSSYRREQNYLKQDRTAAPDIGDSEIVITTASGRQVVYSKREGKGRPGGNKVKSADGASIHTASGPNAHGVNAGRSGNNGVVTGRGVSVGGGAGVAISNGNGGIAAGRAAGHGGGRK